MKGIDNMGLWSKYPCDECKHHKKCKYASIERHPKDSMLSELIEPIEKDIFSIVIICNRFEMEDEEK